MQLFWGEVLKAQRRSPGSSEVGAACSLGKGSCSLCRTLKSSFLGGVGSTELRGLFVAVDWALCPYQARSSGGSDTLPYTHLQKGLSPKPAKAKFPSWRMVGRIRGHLSGDLFTPSPQISFGPLPPPRPSNPVNLSGPELRPHKTAPGGAGIPRKGEKEKVGTALWRPERLPSGPRGSRALRKGAVARRWPDSVHPGGVGPRDARRRPPGPRAPPTPPVPGSYLR